MNQTEIKQEWNNASNMNLTRIILYINQADLNQH